MIIPACLPACARVHPGRPSEIKISTVQRKGKPYQRCVCSTCRSVTALSQPRTAKTFGERERIEWYGVIRLNWTPPEVLLGAPVYVANLDWSRHQ